jgi:hypothetical protein
MSSSIILFSPISNPPYESVKLLSRKIAVLLYDGLLIRATYQILAKTIASYNYSCHHHYGLATEATEQILKYVPPIYFHLRNQIILRDSRHYFQV